MFTIGNGAAIIKRKDFEKYQPIARLKCNNFCYSCKQQQKQQLCNKSSSPISSRLKINDRTIILTYIFI